MRGKVYNILTACLCECVTHRCYLITLIYNAPFQVCRKPAASASRGDLYETKLLEEFADTDAVIEFFACLDLQLNKVNQFYRTKEREFLERGDLLKKRMAILIKLKTGLKQQGKGSSSPDSENDSISGTILCRN